MRTNETIKTNNSKLSKQRQWPAEVVYFSLKRVFYKIYLHDSIMQVNYAIDRGMMLFTDLCSRL